MPDEPVTEADVTIALVQAAAAAGLHPAYLHAINWLGFVVTEDNHQLMTDEMLSQWDETVEAYLTAHPEMEPPS